MEQIIKDNVKDTRLESLFTKQLTHLKEVNPDGYLANLHNWELVINELINKGVFVDSIAISTEVLNGLSISQSGKVLKLQSGILNVVINDMVNETGELIPLSHFKANAVDRTTISKILHKVISSTIYDMSYDVGSRDGSLRRDKLISIRKLKELSLQIYDYYKYEFLINEEYSDYLIRKDHLWKLIIKKEFKISEFDFTMVLLYLSRDLKMITVKDDVIKFKNESIDESDCNVSSLKSTIYKLTNLNEQLNHKLVQLKQEILKNVAIDNKKYAKLLLQNYKKIESNLINQSIQLNNLTTLLNQINQQSFNKELISTITSNSLVLQKLNQSTELDKLQQVLDTMSDNIDDSDKITELLSSTSNIDDSEIDKELDQLVAIEKDKKSTSLGKTELGVDDGSIKKELGKTELGKTEAGKTEIGKTEAGKTELGKTELGKTELGKTEVGKTEAGERTDIGKTEVGKTEVGKTESGKVEDKTDIGKTESGATESDKSDKDKSKEKLPVYA